jgi:hypothetical protein
VGAKYVVRILPRGNRRDLESQGKFGGKVFQTMHRQIDAALGQRVFDFLGEHAFGANFGKGNVGDFVTGGLDDLEFYFMTAFAQ